MGRQQEEKHGMVPCKCRDSDEKHYLRLMSAWPLSAMALGPGDACTTWGDDASPVGWQEYLMWNAPVG